VLWYREEVGTVRIGRLQDHAPLLKLDSLVALERLVHVLIQAREWHIGCIEVGTVMLGLLIRGSECMHVQSWGCPDCGVATCGGWPELRLGHTRRALSPRS